ncbi:MAG: hypothetical protein ACRD1S_14680 [Vicinamibacterales bacterium]
MRTRIRSAFIALIAVTLAIAGLTAAISDHRERTFEFGSSGGNVNSINKRFCCSGTLGALVADAGGAEYILSNNHVLARSDKAGAGEDVSQPGLIDNGCQVHTVVADFTAAAPLGSNVDAGLAELRTGLMDTTGSILEIGIPSSTTLDPAVNMGVAKSGRTTGKTTGSIGAINVSVNVQYQAGCGQGKKFIVSYTNQVVINSSTFSAGGDSGSLIVTNNGSRNPVALLFAGSSSTTIANPIDEVLLKLSAALGSAVSFDVLGAPSGAAAQDATLSDDEIARGTRAKEAHAARLMADPSVFAVGVGADADEPGRAAVVVYVARGRGRGAIERRLDGVATQIVETDPIVAYGWNEPMGGGCSR